MPPPTGPLRLGLVCVIRPLFKGDSRRVAAESEAGLRRLGEEVGFELVTSSLTVTDGAGAEAAARELGGLDLDFLLIQHTTFATGDLLAPLLTASRRVGVWAVPEAAGLANAQPGMGSGPLPLNALCGLNMTMSLLGHPAVGKEAPVKWFYGTVDEGAFRSRLLPTLAALRGLRAIEGARVLQVGGTAPGFYGLEERLELSSVTVETRSLSDLFERVERVSEAEAFKRAQLWETRETTQGVSFSQLKNAVRIEVALEAMAQEGGYDALAVRCWPELPERCGAMGCATLGRLGDGRVPAACEGDVMGALSMLALQGVSERPAILMDLSDLDDSDDSLLFWHCGNAPWQWAAEGGTRLTTHFNRDTLGVVRDMVLRPGPATGFRLLRGGRGAVILSGRFGEPSKPSFDGVRGWLRDLHWDGVRLSARAAVAGVLDHRLPHHLAFGEGELTGGLRELCLWLGATRLVLEPEPPAP